MGEYCHLKELDGLRFGSLTVINRTVTILRVAMHDGIVFATAEIKQLLLEVN
ncbi:hypothetical protein [Streptococcus pyogenes]|uniref:hypothetical protein n=1 Tax=Streptococcus pyogenes TaxID=1314 RepID=UPI001D101414|nr:hypothetical protein [Streptococcus pyogenes]